MMRSKRRSLSLLAALATLLSGLGLALIGQNSAQAHGVTMTPGSRTYLCYLDARTSTGSLDPTNAACKAALAESGANSLYNWFAVLDSNAGGRNVGYVPDGKLCSAGDRSPYNFTGYNAARGDWPRTHLTSGSAITVKHSNWAAHPGDFRVYISKPGYSPTQPLGWGDLELVQTVTNPPQSGSVGTDSGHYYWDLTLPSGRSGDAVMFIQWVRSDSQENFFSCSDIVFDGGKGEVTGIRGAGTTPTPTPTPTDPTPTPTPTPTDPTPTPTPTDDPHTGCMAVYSVTSQWNGGFQGSVEVMNHNTTARDGWAVAWQPGTGTKINQVWNGSMSTGSDGKVKVRNVDYNRVIPPDGTTTFGFTATSTGNNLPIGSIGCVTP
ncbi:lytic polysaccharide monooxygenase [Streptomyces sp. NPDC059166]|uniref:lytic polysaccharide monooxygenase n=1 Tax=Streptomyces sp. NPDC059166 TaxID=3346752 RepID=UPI0036BF2633